MVLPVVRCGLALLILPAVFLMAGAGRVQAVEYFVSTAGSDTNDGLSDGTAFRTIQKGVNVAVAGDVVQVRGNGGVYAERITIANKVGAEAAPIVLKTYDGDPPAVVDLTGVAVPKTSSKEAIIKIENCHWVVVRGMAFRNFRTAGTNAVQASQTPVGIYVNCTSGNTCSHIVLRECEVSGIWQSSTALYDFDANAHGIIVMGRSASALTGLVIENCKVFNLRLGASEAVALNGNVSRFRIANNEVHDCNNIGIDMIGFEDAYKGSVAADVSEDQARHGECVRNHVYNIDSALNPAYGGSFTNTFASESVRNSRRAAGGIYVDGGRDVVIEGNVVQGCNFGVEIASEHFGRTTTDCVVTGNVVSGCHVGGIVLGGGDVENGGVSGIVISHNTLLHNDPTSYGGGQVLMNNRVNNTAIIGNVMVAGKTAAGAPPLYVLKHATNGGGITMDGNIYSGVPMSGGQPSVPVGFEWNGVDRLSMAAWKTATGQEANSRFVEKPVLKYRVDENEPDIGLLQPGAGE